MSILGLDHAGVTVASLDRSLAFYEGLLGLGVAAISLLESPVIEAVTGYPGARLRIADMALPAGGVLELIQYEVPDVPPVVARHAQAGTAHIALQVTGLRDLHARLVAAGADLISTGPVEVTGSGAFLGVLVLYLRDPDGNVIELIERPAAP
jgi:catechol 2,3-dioxygenase-like lactoylglutathione lyase family enzyme